MSSSTPVPTHLANLGFKVGPARPLFPKDVIKVKAEITDLEGKIEAHTLQLVTYQDQLRSAEERVLSIEEGRLKRSSTAAQKGLAKSKRQLSKFEEQADEDVEKWQAEIEKKQHRLDHNDEAMKTYLAWPGNQGSQWARDEAQRGNVYTGKPTGVIRKTTHRVPRAPVQDAVSHSLQRRATASKFAALKRRTEDRMVKGTRAEVGKSQKEKKTDAEATAKKAASTKKSSSLGYDGPSTKKSAKAPEKAVASPLGSAAPVAPMAAKKRKLVDLSEHDEEQQAKKRRSSSEQEEPKRRPNPPRTCRLNAAARKNYIASLAPAKERSGEKDAQPSDAEGESSEKNSLSGLFSDEEDVADVDDIYGGPADELAGEKPSPDDDCSASQSSLKRKRDDSEDSSQGEHATKKAQLSGEASSAYVVKEQNEMAKGHDAGSSPQSGVEQLTSDDDSDKKKLQQKSNDAKAQV